MSSTKSSGFVVGMVRIMWISRLSSNRQYHLLHCPRTPGQIHFFDGVTDYEGVIIHFNASFMADEETSESVSRD